MTIKAILFDFGQTLVDSSQGFRQAEKRAQTAIFADLGLRSWPEFLSKYRKLRSEYHERSNFSRMALWQAVYTCFGRQPEQAFLSSEEQSYWRTVRAKTSPFPEASGVLEQLAAKHRLAIVTNSQGSLEKHRLAAFPELQHHFDAVIVAGEGGVPPKPDPEPFLICLEMLGIAASEAVYVGDDWRIDILGAGDAGIQPVWLKHHLVPRNWPRVSGSVPVITSLDSLPDLLSSGSLRLPQEEESL
jgi:HAD superfamily hydrolase (TIGR01549 family)